MIGIVSNRKLNLCPFCACTAILENLVVEAVVRCTGCRAKIVRKHEPKRDTGIREAQVAWNRRVPQANPEGNANG